MGNEAGDKGRRRSEGLMCVAKECIIIRVMGNRRRV